MSKTIITILILFLGFQTFSQDIKEVVAFKSIGNDDREIFCITDSAVYKYSWYLEWYWWALENNGLTRHNGIVQIDDITAYENEDEDSKIYVISDTAVFRYDWYAQSWWNLENTGLCRINDTVQLSSINAIIDNDGDTRVYAVSCGQIYLYEWYQQSWYPLSSIEISVKEIDRQKMKNEIEIFPNPVSENTTINYSIPENYNQEIMIILYNNKGTEVEKFNQGVQKGGNYSFSINCSNIDAGCYYIEITGKQFRKTGRFIK